MWNNTRLVHSHTIPRILNINNESEQVWYNARLVHSHTIPGILNINNESEQVWYNTRLNLNKESE